MSLFGWFRRTPLAGVRWVVIDCETSGLDPRRDRLLAAGAVAVRGGRIELGEAFSAVLAQKESSTAANIVIHGIGTEAQLTGRPPAEALRELSRFVAGGVPVGFHASFDAAVLRRAFKAAAIEPLPRRWVDLAELAPAFYPRERRVALDDWLARFGIVPQARHDAAGDALATAQLLLVLLDEGARRGIHTLEDLLAAPRLT